MTGVQTCALPILEMEDELQSGYAQMQQQKAQQQQAQMEQEAQARMAETQAKNEKDMNVASTYADATKEAEAMKQEGQTARDLINNQHERRMNNG